MGHDRAGSPPRQPPPHVLRATIRKPGPGWPIQAKLGAPSPAAHVRRALVVQRSAALVGGGGGAGGGSGSGAGKQEAKVSAPVLKKGPTILKSARFFGKNYDDCVNHLRNYYANHVGVIYVTNGLHWGFENGFHGPGSYEYFGFALDDDLETKKQHFYTGNFTP